jgi:hypothetical protein
MSKRIPEGRDEGLGNDGSGHRRDDDEDMEVDDEE